MPAPLRIVFMGTPGFAVPALEALVRAGFPPVAVVTVPDRPQGRGQEPRPSAIKEAAVRLGLPVLQPERLRDPAFAAALRDLRPDVICVVAFRILPPEVYGLAARGAFNLHASLLPAYRGAAPIQRAILNGELETGVTTFLLQPAVDTGDILLKRRVPIEADETAGELHDKLAEAGAELVVETVRQFEAGTVDARPQDDERASLAPKISREDARIPWTWPAEDAHNLVRAMSPVPAAWTTHGETLLKVYRTRPTDDVGEPGEVLEVGPRLVVACGEGALELLEVQREGKRRMPAAELLQGYPIGVADRMV